MRLEFLGTLLLGYDNHGFTFVKPFAGREGQGFGTGTGHFAGERLTGDVRWANYPRVRDDGVAMPDLRGVIATDVGPVLFELHGYSLDTEEEHRGLVVSSMTFRTDAEGHRWLNDVIAVHDGHIDFSTMSGRFPTYVCLPE